MASFFFFYVPLGLTVCRETLRNCFLIVYFSSIFQNIYLFIVQKNCFVSVKKKEKYWTLKKEEKKDKLRLF